ncbi:MAG: radical SAM protein [Myxococcota bacterium]
MLTEAQRTPADGGSWVEQHEEAAHQKRNWVRLTFDCNDHCIFCLDTQAHDGQMRDVQEVKAQILDGRRKGAERLILSGGEPTIHPNYIDFIKLGRLAGYPHIQTVTNGRLFKYRQFLTRCADAGLREITFSIHGPNAKVHDALVGVKGAFDEELEGLKNALEDGRIIVNIDVCVNRGNVKHLDTMLEKFTAMGVREYDLLHVIPFGNAWRDGKEVLFYDLEAMRPHLVKAFAWAKKPDMHIWLNRFPVKHCEGFHELIQDPYKLNDEIRGRKEEFQRWINVGEALDCREPRRCGHCYLKHVCDTFEDTQREVFLEARFDVVRVDAEWEAQQAPVFGGDPASAKRGKKRLPMAQLTYRAPDVLARDAGAKTLQVVGRDLASVSRTVERFADLRVELFLDDWSGLGAALGEGLALDRAYVKTRAAVEELAALNGDFEIVLDLTSEVAPWLLELGAPPAPRFALRQPTWERLTESKNQDIDLRAFFSALRWEVPVEGVPACVLGRDPRPRRRVYDTAMATPDGKLEAFRFVQRHILDGYYTKSLRCSGCIHEEGCRGLHVNYVRAHGFEAMQPVFADAE